MQGRGVSSSQVQSGYVPYEPKKREMTQKIAPKMPLPLTQDLTNLPLPLSHQEQPATEKQINQPVKLNSHGASQGGDGWVDV